MNIAVTTYIDNEKLMFEKNIGDYSEDENSANIKYVDKNKKKYEIIVDKKNDNVSIVKDDTAMLIKKSRAVTNYATDYGILNLETKLIGVARLEKNNFVQFEIKYKIYFSKKDSQENRLKVLIRKN